MSALDTFLDERRQWPWTSEHNGLRFGPEGEDGAPGGKLYARYVEVMKAEGQPFLNPKSFGMAVVAAGFARHRMPDGVFYPELMVASREECAIRETKVVLGASAYRAAASERRAEHEARQHPDGEECQHWFLPEKVIQECRGIAEASIDPVVLTETVENWYGVYLRWRPGEEHPTVVAEREELAAIRAMPTPLSDELAEREKELVTIERSRALLDAWHPVMDDSHTADDEW